MITFRKVNKSFGQNHVLRGLDLEIFDGEILVILGRSGSGKSVMLKHMVGLMKPDSGEIEIDGDDMTKLHGPKLYSRLRDVGMIFQMGAMFDSMSVHDNVAFYLEEHLMRGGKKIKRSDIRELVEEALKSVDLEGTADLYPSSLSGGMRKRASLARSIVFHPKYLFYDEPTTGLDPVTASTIADLMISLHQKLKGTTIVVSHDIVTTLSIADRIALIEDGEIEIVDRPEPFMNYDHPTIACLRHSIGNNMSLIRNRGKK